MTKCLEVTAKNCNFAAETRKKQKECHTAAFTSTVTIITLQHDCEANGRGRMLMEH
jgi:hypothetical protein